jgi:Arc-like DNA binding domain
MAHRSPEVKLNLRFSEALRRRLERTAARNNRSMNTEIIHRLESSLDQEELEQRLGPILAARTRYGEAFDKWISELIGNAVETAVERVWREDAGRAEKPSLLRHKEEGSK